MGIMITYGSYVKPDVDLNKAVNQIEIFDTGVAFLAGAMIIPAVFVFSGTEGMGNNSRTNPKTIHISEIVNVCTVYHCFISFNQNTIHYVLKPCSFRNMHECS